MSSPTSPESLRRAAATLLAQADALEAKHCTGLTAFWCPRHGDCCCPTPEDALDDPNCPLHSPDSMHAALPEGGGTVAL